MAAIRVDGLCKSYGAVRAVDGMDLTVDRGELFGFLGPNGAGKTTTIRALTGQVRPDSGTIRVLETDPTVDPLETRRRVGILPERGSPPSFLTPSEYLAFVGRIRDLEPDVVADRTERWADRLGFRSKLETLHTDLSRGQQQKVMIAQAFIHEPDVVLIDEPLANLDPLVQEQVKRFLLAYAADDNAIFVSTHNIDVAEAICSRVGIVADGRLVAERVPEADDEPLLETFLEYVGDADPRDVPARDRLDQ
ncbi:ABC transporter ATP-binding protein [Natrarchaeobaculum sulfurireducens]|uniref:ABC transporter, ATP-binding protein n=1 Tax=Natrarchaeobaculum sulfurireducens TaxID=2044521 RepID=A0A346PGJ8_9EURY|nr:ABC transporter ATP-binding protein [Natrarchaeobaculum sulfurireducens]AXR78643.1 ABC-type multidrug transport system, ATPase component [Natrarchaeobaculum sulfurireducens]AXR81305.1 ABC transporter, ATP-binding protein [Natrarchaeobaculum sulfurireducens]